MQGYLNFWETLDEAALAMGFVSLKAKLHLPTWLLYVFAYLCEFVGFCFGVTFKLNLFNVRVLTMHRWFNISAAETDLGYQPIVSYKEAWPDTLEWFRTNWLPTFYSCSSPDEIVAGKQVEADLQAASMTSIPTSRMGKSE
jgi:hypothetical protein